MHWALGGPASVSNTTMYIHYHTQSCPIDTILLYIWFQIDKITDRTTRTRQNYRSFAIRPTLQNYSDQIPTVTDIKINT